MLTMRPGSGSCAAPAGRSGRRGTTRPAPAPHRHSALASHHPGARPPWRPPCSLPSWSAWPGAATGPWCSGPSASARSARARAAPGAAPTGCRPRACPGRRKAFRRPRSGARISRRQPPEAPQSLHIHRRRPFPGPKSRPGSMAWTSCAPAPPARALNRCDTCLVRCCDD